MHVTDELIDKLARLSMLQVRPEAREGLKSDLERMIGFIDKLQELDTSGLEPLMHLQETAPLRADEPGNMLEPAAALQNAPRHDGTYFQVPRAIRKASEKS